MSIRFGKRKFVGDAVIAAVLVALCLIPLAADILIGSDATQHANVHLDGTLIAVLPLDTDTVFSPDGGHTFVTVQNGRAFISSSDCPDGVCMEMDGVSMKKSAFSGNAVCVPNKVAVTAAHNSTDISHTENDATHHADAVAG